MINICWNSVFRIRFSNGKFHTVFWLDWQKNKVVIIWFKIPSEKEVNFSKCLLSHQKISSFSALKISLMSHPEPPNIKNLIQIYFSGNFQGISYLLIFLDRGGQPKLVSGLQLEIYAKNIDFLGRMITKTWRDTQKISKNRWFSILVWAAEISLWAAGWPPLF